MSVIWDERRLGHRRAVEALRSGVPNADAVAELGSGQSEIEDRFVAALDEVETGGARGSLLLTGGFGEGKSHLLSHLAQLALRENFVVSTVVVSKETPLHDPAKMLRSAVESAVAPGNVREVIAEAVDNLDPESPAWVELLRWVQRPAGEIDERFDAALFLLDRLRRDAPGADEEYGSALVRFFAGDPLPMPDLRRQLKAVGEGKRYTFGRIGVRELARQRLRFLPRLLKAAGYAGWVVLLDEVELIGRYSVLQRGRSYAELARWLDGNPLDAGEPVVSVAAVTDDFDAAVLVGKNDRAIVPGKLRDKQNPEFDELATLAEAGMAHIQRDAIPLAAPDAAELDSAYDTLKRLHGVAHDWSPPDVPGLERLGATRMRQHVRAWINEWDLVRQDPAYHPLTEVLDVTSDYRESDALDEG